MTTEETDLSQALILSMLGYVKLWRDDAVAGLDRTDGSLAAAQEELELALEELKS